MESITEAVRQLTGGMPHGWKMAFQLLNGIWSQNGTSQSGHAAPSVATIAMRSLLHLVSLGIATLRRIILTNAE